MNGWLNLENSIANSALEQLYDEIDTLDTSLTWVQVRFIDEIISNKYGSSDYIQTFL